MIWWLIYNVEDIEPNKSYINFYFEECKIYGIKLYLIIRDRLHFCTNTNNIQIIYDGKSVLKPNVVINRSRDYLLSKSFEYIGTKVCNNSEVTLLGNNKLLALQYVSNLGIDIMPTYYGDSDNNLPEYPFVLKSLSGHGGKEVFYISNYEMLMTSLKKLEGKDYIYQKVASDLGKDLRVYIVGNKIVTAMLRKSDHDFRSNYCLGGLAFQYELNIKEKDIVLTIINNLEIGHCGIDFIFDNGKMIFNEIEDVVGSRMLYQYTNINIVKEYVEFIYSNLDK